MHLQAPEIDPSLLAAAAEDPELAAAIAASLSTIPPKTAETDAEEMRRRRLARFG
jgi:hypothetical protein